MANLIGKNVLIVDEVDDTRTTLEYAVRELEKDVELAQKTLGREGEKTTFSIFVLHVSVPFSVQSRAWGWPLCRTRTRWRKENCPRRWWALVGIMPPSQLVMSGFAIHGRPRTLLSVQMPIDYIANDSQGHWRARRNGQEEPYHLNDYTVNKLSCIMLNAHNILKHGVYPLFDFGALSQRLSSLCFGYHSYRHQTMTSSRNRKHVMRRTKSWIYVHLQLINRDIEYSSSRMRHQCSPNPQSKTSFWNNKNKDGFIERYPANQEVNPHQHWPCATQSLPAQSPSEETRTRAERRWRSRSCIRGGRRGSMRGRWGRRMGAWKTISMCM